jgi:hypothetical protein
VADVKGRDIHHPSESSNSLADFKVGHAFTNCLDGSGNIIALDLVLPKVKPER